MRSQVIINLIQKHVAMLHFLYDSNVSNSKCDSDNEFDL